MTKLTFEEVVASIKQERDRQDAKWGPLEDRNQSIAGFLLVLQAELDEAVAGWIKNKEGDHSSLNEIRQVAAVAVACLMTHGLTGN